MQLSEAKKILKDAGYLTEEISAVSLGSKEFEQMLYICNVCDVWRGKRGKLSDKSALDAIREIIEE
jgi:hypothetical protein